MIDPLSASDSANHRVDFVKRQLMSDREPVALNHRASLAVAECIRDGDDQLRLRLAGDWLVGSIPRSHQRLLHDVAVKPPTRLILCAADVGRWDSGLITYVLKVRKVCEQQGVGFTTEGLAAGAQRLLRLADVAVDKHTASGRVLRTPFLERLGELALACWHHGVEMVGFLGEVSVASARLLSGRARCRSTDVLTVMLNCGVRALPIVSLISVLVGLILAFVGAVQLSLFGAQIYVASLVGIAVVRVMGAVMAGIIMAGRTGAAFAAELGTMQVNEEIDALRTLGIDPIEFLVLPRVLGLVLMMPLLCLYADMMGILGGLLVGVFMLDLNVMEYLEMTKKAVKLNYFWIGLFHSAVFGVLVALAGCLRGMQCGRSASAVGAAATSAVVTGIVSIIAATAVITVICNVLGI